MPRIETGSLPLQIILFIGLIFVAFAFAVGITEVKATLAIAAVLGIAVFIVSFLSTEAALYVLIFSMLLSPEFGARDTKGSGFSVRLDDFLLLLIGFSWFAKTAIYKELGLFLKTPLNPPIRYYTLACFISTAWGVLSGRVELTGFFFIIKYIEYFIVYFMVVNHIRRRKQISSYYVSALVTCTIVALVAIAQIPGGERITAPFEGKGGEPNTLGGYLVFMLSLILGVLLTSDSSDAPKKRFALLALCGFIIVPLLYTQSRGSWIATAVMFMGFIAFSEKRVKLIAALVIGVTLLVISAPKEVKDRVSYTFTKDRNPWAAAQQENLGVITLDTSASERIRSWKEVWQDFPNHPFLGYGVTGWKFLDAQYGRTLIETGVIGLFTLIGLLVTIFRELWRVYRQMTDDRFYRGIALGTLVGLIAMMAHAVTANTFIIVRIMEPFWLFVGMVIMMPRLKEEEGCRLQVTKWGLQHEDL
jgi:O-antigen ligase